MITRRSRRALAEHLGAALPAWVVARVVVLGALALGRFVHDSIGANDRPSQLHDGLLAWDAGWYAAIADHGYERLPLEAVRFFPLAPLAARAVSVPLGGNSRLATVLVANVAALVAGMLLFRLARYETHDRGLATRAAWLLALAPPAFVLVMGYAEALLLTLSIATFLALRRRQWGHAAVVGALAGLCRPFGALLALPAAVEAARGWPEAAPPHRAARVAAVVAPLAGAGAYLAWVGHTFGDWLLPLRIQDEAGRRGGLHNPLAALADSAGALVGDDRTGTGVHFLWAILFVVLVVATFRRWPASYGVFAAATVVVAVSAENLDSLERYGLSAFPLLLAAASLTGEERRERVVLTLAVAGLAAYSLLALLGEYVP